MTVQCPRSLCPGCLRPYSFDPPQEFLYPGTLHMEPLTLSCHVMMHHDGTKFHAPGNVEQITPVQEAVRIARDSVPTQTTTSRKPRTKPTGAVCWSHLLEPWQSCTSSLVSHLDETWGARNPQDATVSWLPPTTKLPHVVVLCSSDWFKRFKQCEVMLSTNYKPYYLS